MKPSTNRRPAPGNYRYALPLALLACAAAACGGPPPPAPAPPLPKAAHAKAIVTAQPSATPAAPPAAPPKAACTDEPEREKHGTLSLEGGKWLVEEAGGYDARIWEMGPDGPKLRARLEAGEMRFLPGDRVSFQRDDDLVIVDLPTGNVHVFEKAWLLAATADFFFVTGEGGDRKVGRRLRAKDFSLAGTVAWDDALDLTRGAEDTRPVDGGNSLALGVTLVSFTTGKVLQKGLLFGTPRADGKRISACESASRSIVEVDAATGAIGARFPMKVAAGTTECGTSDYAAYADDHTIFWFEAGKDTKDAGRKMSVAAGDTRTGKVSRFDDPSQTWSIGFSSYPFLEGGRLCTTIASFHTSWGTCNWALASGRVVRSPEPPKSPSVADVGLKGTVESARATSPSGERVALLTYHRTGKGEATKKTDLRITFATKDGKKESSVVLEAGEIQMDDSTSALDSGDTPPPWADLSFFDEAALGVFAGPYAAMHGKDDPTEHGAGTWLVNASTGVAKPLCGEDGCYQVGRFVAPEKGKLQDPLTGRVFDLTPTEAEWASVPRVAKGCH